MPISVVCLSTSPRFRFFQDFLESFTKYARPNTQLLMCVQGYDDQFCEWLWTEEKPANIVPFFYQENAGLSRYDDIVSQCKTEIVVDTDDDSILFPGFEEIFEAVLADKRFGWVGFPVRGTQVQSFPNGREWNINCYRVVEAPVGGGLAATRKSIWFDIGGFGTGKTLFDPEDARYQRKCQANGYLTGIIVGKLGIRNTTEVYVEEELSYIHNGDWEHHIRYGTALQKLESLRQAMLAGFINEIEYRQSLQEYLKVN